MLEKIEDFLRVCVMLAMTILIWMLAIAAYFKIFP